MKKENKQKKLEEIMSKDFIKGLKTGLKIANQIAKRQGYEFDFPEVNDMLIERMEKNKK